MTYRRSIYLAMQRIQLLPHRAHLVMCLLPRKQVHGKHVAVETRAWLKLSQGKVPMSLHKPKLIGCGHSLNETKGQWRVLSLLAFESRRVESERRLSNLPPSLVGIGSARNSDYSWQRLHAYTCPPHTYCHTHPPPHATHTHT